MQQALSIHQAAITPFKTQLLKWVGNKQRFAHEIVGYFPKSFDTYYEPFLGSGAILAALSPQKAFGSDAFAPLIEIFHCLKEDPEKLKIWYRERWETANGDFKKKGYEQIKESFNLEQNGADFLFLCRACYGGVVRFRQSDGYMSTPCGVHAPIKPESFNQRVDLWYERVKNTVFLHQDYKDAMRNAERGDLVYCDPPYKHSQSILYGGQSFSLDELFDEIESCRKRGAFVALSIDGTKKSGAIKCDLDIPDDLFEREIYVNLGGSMLRRFQMEGETQEGELVTDRLLLTY